MGSIEIHFDKSDLESFLQEKVGDLLPKAIEMIDDVSNSFKDTMLSYTPMKPAHLTGRYTAGHHSLNGWSAEPNPTA